MSVSNPVFPRIRITAVLMVGLFVWVVSVHAAGDAAVKHVNGIGSAIIQGKNVADARRNSVADALSMAVGQAVADVLPAETVSQQFQLINEKILAQPETFIQNYRVVTRAVSGNTVRALVQVDISMDRLRKDLGRLGILVESDTDTPVVSGSIDVTVAGTGGHIASFVRLRSAISSLTGVKDLMMKEMTTDQALIGVQYQGSAQSLADALMQRGFEGFAIEIEEVTESSVTIRLRDQ